MPEGFYPHFNEVALRMTLLAQVPELADAHRRVRELMQSGSVALIIDRLHIDAFPVPVRNRLLYALCLAVGFPTPSSQHQATLLWNVRVRPVPAGRSATYSEHSGEADLHTDSQSFPQPEEYFALYVDRAARCGGGASLFLSADSLHQTLASTAEGREALGVLSTWPFPFYISAGEAGASGAGAVTLAPILGPGPAIRFRRDVLEKGFAARPDLDTPETRHAFEFLLEVLARQAPVVEYQLPDGSIALCDNHRMLHGRTGFTDQHRHLLRVRMSAQPVAVHIASFLEGKESFAQAVLS